jgi:serine/threonine protein kinase
VQRPIRVGRYVLYGEIAAGGMATVHYGRVRGAASFARIVAVKRLHPHLAKDDDFGKMFLDEARIAARIQHPNAANILDVVSLPEGELLIVMEYIPGESLSRILKRLRTDAEHTPPDVVCAIVCDGLHGLHAAHEAKNDQGEALGIVHRDVSPHNLLVGGDGITRLVDFGVAKARGRIHATREGQVKGKIAYMPPEQLRGKAVDRRCDIYSMGIVLWEALTTERLFHADSEGETVTNVLEHKIIAPSDVRPSLPKALDAITLKALSRDPKDRYATARDMATAIEAATRVASARGVASFVQTVAGHVLDARKQTVAELEKRTDEEDSAMGTPGGVDVPLESQVSSGSMTTDTGPGFLRKARGAFALVALGALLVVGAVFALRARTSPVPVVTSPVTVTASTQPSAPPAPPVITPVDPEATAKQVTAPSVTAARSVPAVVTVVRTVTRTAPPAGTGDRPCPVKTFVDADGIVQFRRECP